MAGTLPRSATEDRADGNAFFELLLQVEYDGEDTQRQSSSCWHISKNCAYAPDAIHLLTECIFVNLQEGFAAAAAAALKLAQVICPFSGIQTPFSGEGGLGVGEKKLEPSFLLQ
jgi:hypothetical protein